MDPSSRIAQFSVWLRGSVQIYLGAALVNGMDGGC